MINKILEESVERHSELKLWSYFYDQDDWFSFDIKKEWSENLDTWKVVTDSKGYWIVSGKV